MQLEYLVIPLLAVCVVLYIASIVFWGIAGARDEEDVDEDYEL